MSTSAYCRARKKLIPETIKKIAVNTGADLKKDSKQWRFKQRDVYLVDGTIIDLEDTKELKSSFPAPMGPPKLRLLGLFDYASGAFLDGEIGKCVGKGESEQRLFRDVLSKLKDNSILVLDRLFSGYFLQELIEKSNQDYVIRVKEDYAKSRIKNKKDLIVTLKRPYKSKYKGDNYSAVAPAIRVRIIKSVLKRKGFRPTTHYLTTSLFDEKYEDICSLYAKRWNVELDFRNLKVTLGKINLL